LWPQFIAKGHRLRCQPASLDEHDLKVIAANDTMIAAHREGIAGNGKPFPDGSKVVKIVDGLPKRTPRPPSRLMCRTP